MPPTSLAHAKEIFRTFRVESIWLRSIHDTSQALFSSGKQTDEALRRTAPRFFADLNHILIEYWVLVVCRLTDPAKSMGRENLTAMTLMVCLTNLHLLTPEIEAAAIGIQRYRDVLNDARNKFVSHADKETFLNPALLGEHTEQRLNDFLLHLQIFNDLVGEALGEGPLDFSGTSGPGDAHDLVRALQNAA